MRQDRHFSLLRRLLPEHHVYVRSGSSEPLRGVDLAVAGRRQPALLAAVALWTGLASYGWIAAHLETLEQRRELARLAQVNQRLEALAAALRHRRRRALAAGVRSLVAELEEVKAGGQRDIGLPDAAAAEAPDRCGPRRLPTGGLAERLLPAAMQINASGSGRDWLYDRIARERIDDPTRAAETIRLRDELRSARAEIARLENALRHEAAGRTAERR